MTTEFSTKAAFDIKRAWKQTKQDIEAMTPEQRKASLVRAGVLTRGGSVARPYVKVIK